MRGNSHPNVAVISTLFSAWAVVGHSPERRGKRWGISSCWHATHPFVLFLKLTSSRVRWMLWLCPGRCIFPSGSSAQLWGSRKRREGDSHLWPHCYIIKERLLYGSRAPAQLKSLNMRTGSFALSSSPTLKIHAGEIRLWWRVLNSKDREPCCWRQKSSVGPWSLFPPLASQILTPLNLAVVYLSRRAS